MTGDDQGSALVEFVLLGALVTMLFLGVLQVALALHVRNTLIDCASEGARYGGLADRTLDDGAARTKDLIGTALPGDYPVRITARDAVAGQTPVVEVTVEAALPAVGMWGPEGTMTVHGRGLREGGR